MSNQVDETSRWGLIIVTAVVSLVVVGTVGLGVFKARHTKAPQAQSASHALPSYKLYFESGSAALPADAQAVLSEVSHRARADAGMTVILMGFHDATGNAELNAELAKNRAQAVQHALQANGVDPLAISLSKPQVTQGGSDPKEARRVDILLGP